MKKTLIGLSTILHLLPHAFGVSTIGATALYAGTYGNKKTAWSIPLIPLTIGIAVTGWYEPIVMLSVFAGYSLSTLAGYWFLSNKRSYQRFGLAVLVGAGIFYLVSNFAIWWVGYYPPTAAGLLLCYINGLPYFGQAMLADAAYCFVLFGLHILIEQYYGKVVPA